MSLSKRDLLLAMAGGLTAAGLAPDSVFAADPHAAPQGAGHDMTGMPETWHGSEKIAFLIYPGFTALDMVGPHYMLASLMGATTMVVAKSRAMIESDQKIAFMPSHAFEDCPADLDIVCVPGGTLGTIEAMQDKDTMAFLADRGSRAKHVCSVCTGSLILGAAGLLTGYKATSHWLTRDILKEFGAEPVDERVVFDRNRVTGAGVTAGLDFGLRLVAALRDNAYAQGVQLLAEYAPEPPFNAGTPESAPRSTVDLMAGMFPEFLQAARAAARQSPGARKG